MKIGLFCLNLTVTCALASAYPARAQVIPDQTAQIITCPAQITTAAIAPAQTTWKGAGINVMYIRAVSIGRSIDNTNFTVDLMICKYDVPNTSTVGFLYQHFPSLMACVADESTTAPPRFICSHINPIPANKVDIPH